MSTQSADDGPITFINVFEIPEDEIDTFIAQWRQRSGLTTIADGFISAELHRAVDDARFKLVNVSRWRSWADFEAATTDPGFRTELDQYVSATASSWTPNRGFYRTAVALSPGSTTDYE